MNSRAAVFLWNHHVSLSELNIPCPEKIMEDSLPHGALRVVFKPGFEYVLKITRVARDSNEALFTCEERDCADASLVRAVAGL